MLYEVQVLNLVCCLCLNSFRQRRRLKRNLEDWNHLFEHAQAVDLAEDFEKFMKEHDIPSPSDALKTSHSPSLNPVKRYLNTFPDVILGYLYDLGRERELFCDAKTSALGV